jgi:hypothetical protein
MKSFALPLAVVLHCTVIFAAEKKPQEKPKQAAPAGKELTREEIAKLGGFEPGLQEDVEAGICFDVLMVSLPEELGVPIVEMFRDPAKTDAACRKVMDLLQTKKAKVTGWPQITTKNGNRAVAENIQEVRYPTEFEQIDGARNPGAQVPAPPQAAPPPGPPMPMVAGMIPTAFETRNMGATIEVEPTLWPDGKTVDANFIAQHVRLLGWDVAAEHEDGKLKRSIPQPRFQTNKISQTLTLHSGTRHFLGSFLLPGAPGQMELFILGVQVRSAPKPKPAPAR